MKDNRRYLVSRNKREGVYWNNFNSKDEFKVRLHDDEDCSLKAYGKWLKRQLEKELDK